MSAAWTIRQLCDEVARRLASAEAPSNGQVRAVPDERSVRYYTTLGLLDRPSLRGRTALYGMRHLAQLVAIKRLQAEGRALAEIQQIVPTLDDAALSRLAGVAVGPTRRGGARRDFWRAPETEAAAEPVDEAAAPGASPLVPLVELALAPGVRLAVQPARAVTDADAAALLAAAAPLLAELARRRLVQPTSPPANPQTDPEQEESA